MWIKKRKSCHHCFHSLPFYSLPGLKKNTVIQWSVTLEEKKNCTKRWAENRKTRRGLSLIKISLRQSVKSWRRVLINLSKYAVSKFHFAVVLKILDTSVTGDNLHAWLETLCVFKDLGFWIWRLIIACYDGGVLLGVQGSMSMNTTPTHIVKPLKHALGQGFGRAKTDECICEI